MDITDSDYVERALVDATVGQLAREIMSRTDYGCLGAMINRTEDEAKPYFLMWGGLAARGCVGYLWQACDRNDRHMMAYFEHMMKQNDEEEGPEN